MRMLTALLAAAGMAGAASADVTINEVLGSTPGTDYEFIELYNSGGGAVDLTGWSIELWDSDSGGSFGGSDAGAPYALSGILAAGGFLTLGNPTVGGILGFTPDLALPANAIENSSYTMILRDAGAAIVEAIFVTDGGAGDAANDAGTLITPDATVGPDGTFVPAGFYRDPDGSGNFVTFDFDDGDIALRATPGGTNFPAPGSLALLGFGCLLGARRRRA